MNIIRTITSAAVFAAIASTGIAGGYSKSGPVSAEPTVPVPYTPPVVSRFSWTGPYAGAALGYGQMQLSGFNNRSQAAGGLFGGYRQDMGAAVLGAEVILVPTTLGKATLPNGDEVKSAATLLLTAGMPISADARTLGYIGAGPTFMRTKGGGGSKTSTGASVVLGVDHMVTDTVLLRAGLNYTAINKLSTANYKARAVSFGVGVGFKF